MSAPSALKLGWRLVGRLRGDRAVFETPSGVVVLDLGSAHQRVLYENILGQFASGGASAQPLLIPLALELEPLPAAVLREREALLASAGFAFEPYGRNFWRVTAVPAWVDPGEAEPVLRDLLAEMARREGDFGKAHLAADALARLAVARARHRTDNLSDAELLALVQALFRTSQPGVDPRGRKTYFELGDADVARRLGQA